MIDDVGDKFELKFPKPSRSGKVVSLAETELTFMYINKKQIFDTC